MNRRIKWLIWALCVFGLGLIISLSTTAVLEAAIAGIIVLSPTMGWMVMTGLACSALCIVAGVVLAIIGLRTFGKSVN
jgi:TRAP-type C4-dicarboxylate transport system permease small subunit